MGCYSVSLISDLKKVLIRLPLKGLSEFDLFEEFFEQTSNIFFLNHGMQRTENLIKFSFILSGD